MKVIGVDAGGESAKTVVTLRGEPVACPWCSGRIESVAVYDDRPVIACTHCGPSVFNFAADRWEKIGAA